MLTYTKTQLIDRAIQKLGESIYWGSNNAIAYCGDVRNHRNFDTFQLMNYIGAINSSDGWQLACTRQEFEQRIAERKGSWWDFSKGEALRLPPIGCKVLYEGNIVEIVEVTNNPQKQICAKFADGQLAILNLYWIKHLNYKPALTERQQAGLKLWRCIHSGDSDLSEEFLLKQKAFEDYCKPYDQGLLK